MEQLHFDYSLKNIPRCSRDAYLKALINRTEDFLHRLRWKTFFFQLDTPPSEDLKETFGFRSNMSPPVIKELSDFENDVYQLISTIKFRRAPNAFLDKLDADAAKIKTSRAAIVPADKTDNHYQLPVEKYRGLIESSITAEYKKTTTSTVKRINNEAAAIAAKLKLQGRVQCLESSQAFVLLKDHKPNFTNNIPCRLINPAKSDIGKVSKVIIERITSRLRNITSLNQWRSTGDVLSWFESSCVPGRVQFIQFDIESFYPSISEGILDRAICFAKARTDITNDEIQIIKHSRQSLLFGPQGNTWQRKKSLFDVTMGAPDGAEVCELVGVYLLSKISGFIPPQCNGVYRDDGLIMVKNPTGPKMERIRKKLFEIFKEEGLKITVSPPSTSVDFLDVTLRSDGSFRPFRKADKLTNYVNRQSNHPPSIIRNIPDMIAHRISGNSSSREIFDCAKPYYEDALRRSGYSNSSLEYEAKKTSTGIKKKNKRQRKRKILWFNPPYSVTVETNVGRKFLNLLDRHFPSGHPFHKFLNRNSVKVSYSCMSNMEQLIKSRNKQLLQHSEVSHDSKPRECNCRVKDACPLKGKCLTESLVYKATLIAGDEQFCYVGMTEGPFKHRYNGHASSFRLERYRSATKLSEKVWTLRDRGIDFHIEWSIIRRGMPYKVGQTTCDLCTSEKLEIIKRASDPGLLNGRTEILTKCRHKRKFLI